MTFEERLAVQGKKMDELKAKIDEAVADAKAARQMKREKIVADVQKLDAAIDKLDAELDAQIAQQYDTLDKQLAQQCETLDKQVDRQLDKMEQNAAAAEAKVKAAFTLDKDAVEALADAPTGIDAIQKATADQLAAAKGDVVAVEEDARLVKEYNERKRNAVRLHAQMGVENAKARVAAQKEAVDKASYEALILDLLDYADSCQQMAYAWALEAEYAVADALIVIDEYVEKYGAEA